MDTGKIEWLLRKYGVNDAMLDELNAAAAALPPETAAAADISGNHIAGIADGDAHVLMSRLLRACAPALDLQFQHPDVLGMAGYPGWRQLVARADAGLQVAGAGGPGDYRDMDQSVLGSNHKDA